MSNAIQTFSEVFVEENTPEGQKFRQEHIGGSEVGIIMGLSPYKTPYILWLEKLGLIPKQEMTEAMLRGQALESSARDCYIEQTGIGVIAGKRFVYRPWEILSASLDGISDDYKVCYEAKCPTSRKLFDQAYEDKFIPDYYFAQIQTYLLVTQADVCDYHVYMNNNENVIINVCPDKNYHKEILKKCKEFWNMVTTRTPPTRVKGDPYFNENDIATNIAIERIEIKSKIKELETSLEKVDETLKSYMNGESYVIFGSSGLKAKEIAKEGTVNWKQLTEDYEITEEIQNNYRKESSKYIRFS